MSGLPAASGLGRWRQRGESLIGIMVGLVISLLTISVMLVLYKTLIETSANASRSALRDGQVASALLSAQEELQEAGFGVPLSDALDTKLLISDSGKQIVWRYMALSDDTELSDVDTDGTSMCAGFLLEDDSDADTGRGLYRLTPKACSSVTSVTWSSSERVPVASSAAFFEPSQKDGSAYSDDDAEVGALTLKPSSDDTAGYVFSSASDSCLPYMQQDTSSDPLTTSGQRVKLSSTVSGSLFSVCLPNLAYVPAS